ncbi:septation protein SepH [Trueperella pecoris]|uniref:DUF3071 domain-containing protein n=1 Tax=Trueperella pecoris TaxID=2733571 RepID=A0A7M1QWP7_9ACTO|nr:septation protein SepH [Trueperella pecoris]QOR46460.1 DUF3071 domain-containing protein [Trueperella pecoris]
MIELELLGLQEGQKLSLNDSEGNRYVLPITDELRAALRTDVASPADDKPRPITPREIQAHFRAGLSVAEVSKITSFPPSQLNSLAYPIFAEREYTAQNARLYRQGHDAGGMTLEELVVSRLVARGVNTNDIEWDAHRDQGEPWVLVARYRIGDTNHTALWTINTKAQTVTARNDEATWLTENQIPAPSNPWRRPNTPSVAQDEDAAPAEKISAIDARPASSGQPVDIDSMLESLNSKRGKSQPMPEPEFDGAHPADSEPEAAQDATILAFPSPKPEAADDKSQKKAIVTPVSSLSTPPTAPTAESADEADASDSQQPGNSQQVLPGVGQDSAATPKPAKKRRNRPAMPSWDEIVFGYSKDD